MSKVDWTKKSDGELEKTLHDKREALRVFRFGIAGSRIKNVREGRNERKIIARVLTEENRRRHGEK
ncbi:50S ribosomal protein L29 [bacterium]|nr:50S ribosomal protein L29 [bacterium]MCI0566035.1 50S ribosomal protein L29 [bacterium]MCI0680270.1 50S ribosomal protein L29 [bacterium]